MSSNISDEEYLYTLIITVNVTHPALVSLNLPMSVGETTLHFAGIMPLLNTRYNGFESYNSAQHYACYRREAKNTHYPFKLNQIWN